jgi:drug/metabolite transporter (DMT)-like permease
MAPLRKWSKGIYAALTSAVFLGMAPIFGKQAINLGLPWPAVVALRTIIASGLLLLVLLTFRRQFVYIYPAGLLGCCIAGGINGLGSLLYYGALGRIDAGVGQLLYSLYPLFVTLWLWLDRQPPTRLTLFRLALTLPALPLLIQANSNRIDMVGVLMMLGSAALYALHLPINQRVLYDMPTPTVTLYTLLAMSAVVTPVYLLTGSYNSPGIGQGWLPVLGLTLVTFLSRLTLFLGVKHLGGQQTALLGLGEVLIALAFSQHLLGERLSPTQWLGAGLLALSLALIALDKPTQMKVTRGGWLSWLRPPGMPPDLPDLP